MAITIFKILKSDRSESILDTLIEVGFSAVIETTAALEVYCDSKFQNLADARIFLQELGVEIITENKLEERNWTETCPELMLQVEAGKFLIIPDSSIIKSNQNLIPIYLTPAYGFGTGHHPTTKMCLELLSTLESVEERSLLDFGCGSGILSIAGAKIGFKKIFGFDVDFDSVSSSLENILKNQSSANFWCGELASFNLANTKNLVGIANIYRDILIQEAPHLNQFEVLILSGFQTEDQVEVLKHFDFKNVEVRVQDDWVACLLIK